MSFPNIFSEEESLRVIERINKLEPDMQPLWGKMTVGQMLAHCNVTYEYVYEAGKHQKPGVFKRWLLKAFVKSSVVNDTPYKRNSPTAPDFKQRAEKDFNVEKERLINYIVRVQKDGPASFETKASHSFGLLTKEEWNNMFYKHLDHHLRQFGV